MSEVSFKKPKNCNGGDKYIKRGIVAEENQGPAGGSKKDNVNEPTTANTEVEHSGSK